MYNFKSSTCNSPRQPAAWKHDLSEREGTMWAFESGSQSSCLGDGKRELSACIGRAGRSVRYWERSASAPEKIGDRGRIKLQGQFGGTLAGCEQRLAVDKERHNAVAAQSQRSLSGLGMNSQVGRRWMEYYSGDSWCWSSRSVHDNVER